MDSRRGGRHAAVPEARHGGRHAAVPEPRRGRHRARKQIRWGTAVVLAIAVTLALATGSGQPASAHAQITCSYAGSQAVDPIVARGSAQSAHMHDFLGNQGFLSLPTRWNATYDELVSQPTNCENPQDRALYWIPTLYVGGKPLHPFRVNAYYRSWQHNKTDPAGATQPMPADLRLVVGNPHATAANRTPLDHVHWSCGGGSSKPVTQFQAYTPAEARCDQATGKVFLTVGINHPSCWSGTLNRHDVAGNTADFDGPMGSAVDRLAYRTSGSCPAGFGRKLPTLTLSISWKYAGDGSDITFSSGSQWTMHADFLNAWTVAGMKDMVARCINSGTAHSHGSDTVCGN